MCMSFGVSVLSSPAVLVDVLVAAETKKISKKTSYQGSYTVDINKGNAPLYGRTENSTVDQLNLKANYEEPCCLRPLMSPFFG